MGAGSEDMRDEVVVCRGLRKHFGNVVAVDGLDLVVRRGECFGLLGPNGAGKTTTIEILEGLTSSDAGEIAILGRDWKHDARDIRERIGISLQETRLNEKLTIYETLRLFRSFYREGNEPDDVMQRLSLQEKRDARVGKLSGGQRQRLAVACALVGNPEILFLDEPTTGLDPQSRLELWDQVIRFRAEGRTVLLTTHYMDEAQRLCDRIAVVDHGKVIAQGTPRELIATLHAPYIVEFSSEPALEEAEIRAVSGVAGVHRRASNWSANVSSLPVALPAILALLERKNAKLEQLSTHEATLEDVFVSLTGRALRDE